MSNYLSVKQHPKEPIELEIKPALTLLKTYNLLKQNPFIENIDVVCDITMPGFTEYGEGSSVPILPLRQ